MDLPICVFQLLLKGLFAFYILKDGHPLFVVFLDFLFCQVVVLALHIVSLDVCLHMILLEFHDFYQVLKNVDVSPRIEEAFDFFWKITVNCKDLALFLANAVGSNVSKGKSCRNMSLTGTHSFRSRCNEHRTHDSSL